MDQALEEMAVSLPPDTAWLCDASLPTSDLDASYANSRRHLLLSQTSSAAQRAPFLNGWQPDRLVEQILHH